MASKISISTKQAVIGGLGFIALVAGIVVAVREGKKKKKNQQQKPLKVNQQGTKSIMV